LDRCVRVLRMIKTLRLRRHYMAHRLMVARPTCSTCVSFLEHGLFC
jgi:hypothetical protein